MQEKFPAMLTCPLSVIIVDLIWFDLFDLQSPQLVQHSCSARMIWDSNKVIIIIIIIIMNWHGDMCGKRSRYKRKYLLIGVEGFEVGCFWLADPSDSWHDFSCTWIPLFSLLVSRRSPYHVARARVCNQARELILKNFLAAAQDL